MFLHENEIISYEFINPESLSLCFITAAKHFKMQRLIHLFYLIFAFTIFSRQKNIYGIRRKNLSRLPAIASDSCYWLAILRSHFPLLKATQAAQGCHRGAPCRDHGKAGARRFGSAVLR